MSGRGDAHDGGDFAIVLADQTGDDRTALDMSAILAAFERVAGEYGFKLRTWGRREQLRMAMFEEQSRLNREDATAMLQEFRTARDVREAAAEVAS